MQVENATTSNEPASAAVPSLVPVLQGRRALVLGLGASGLAMARWCDRLGAEVTVIDTREAPPQAEALRQSVPTARVLSGEFAPALLDGAPYALVARSPGLAPAQWQPLADAAAAQGVPVVGELDLFVSALKAMATDEAAPYRPQVLAITGTNGKTTVTSLTGLLLERAGWDVV
ncbi:MAG TPA: UDP-N-acetylmuramoyl-L-alanine--D-glutamate ligase, partial [Burkholderiaceae bacterium]|nr:UDP-N-acetylmuramoyl-L-alanine--D-glutamate ligase [Burkholderiaceae bacterium]